MRRAFLFIFFLLITACFRTNVSAQESAYVDSMNQALSSTESDHDKSVMFNDLSTHCLSRNSDSALFFAEHSLLLARKLDDDDLISNSLNSVGNIYNNQGKYSTALPIFMDALSHAQKANDNNRIARINNNIGIVYYYQGEMERSLDHFQTSGSMLIREGDTLGAIFAFNNIAGIYLGLGKVDESMAYFQRGYKLSKQVGNLHAEAVLLSGIANVHAQEKNYELSLAENIEALEIKRKGSNLGTILYSLEAIGQIYDSLNQPHMSLFYYEEMAELSIEAGQPNMQKKAYRGLSAAYEAAGNPSKSLLNLQHYIKLKDSLDEISSTHAIAEIQSKYNKAEDQKKIADLEKNHLIHNAEIERKETWNFVLIAGGIVVVLVAFLIYSRLRTSRNQNAIIREQKLLVDVKNKEVTDSISYAKRIQQAMLKAEVSESGDRFGHFVLFKPKDIVSGDFYWVKELEDSLLVAAVDCTGHGVPGAFLTLLGATFLNEIVSNEITLSPSEILDRLRSRIIKELGQGEGGSTKDGMDMSLVKLYFDKEKIEWAGANNPLWILKKGASEIVEYRANKEHIGYSYKMNPFTNHRIEVGSGDLIYIFSDGYVDQFGGLSEGQAKEKKFKSARLKKLIFESAELDMEAQKSAFDSTFENWKGDIEQLDDVCVIGMKI